MTKFNFYRVNWVKNGQNCKKNKVLGQLRAKSKNFKIKDQVEKGTHIQGLKLTESGVN
jgi:hypothetical protein